MRIACKGLGILAAHPLFGNLRLTVQVGGDSLLPALRKLLVSLLVNLFPFDQTAVQLSCPDGLLLGTFPAGNKLVEFQALIFLRRSRLRALRPGLYRPLLEALVELIQRIFTEPFRVQFFQGVLRAGIGEVQRHRIVAWTRLYA